MSQHVHDSISSYDVGVNVLHRITLHYQSDFTIPVQKHILHMAFTHTHFLLCVDFTQLHQFENTATIAWPSSPSKAKRTSKSGIIIIIIIISNPKPTINNTYVRTHTHTNVQFWQYTSTRVHLGLKPYET